jgi:hypothetical protein
MSGVVFLGFHMGFLCVFSLCIVVCHILFLFVGLGWCEEDIPGGIIAGGDQRKGKEHAPVDNKFLEAMTVLVVDENLFCLKALEVFLRYCKYKCEL